MNILHTQAVIIVDSNGDIVLESFYTDLSMTGMQKEYMQIISLFLQEHL